MENLTETISRYVSAWNEKTAADVKAAIEQCCIEGITYTDKQTPLITGIDNLVSLIMSSYEIFPGRTFSLLTAPEYFDHHCYYTWGVNIPGIGDRAGRDYITYNDDNKITTLVGFLPA